MVSPELMDALGVYGGGSSRSELSKPCCEGGEDTVTGGEVAGVIAGLGTNGFDEGIIGSKGEHGTPVTNYVVLYQNDLTPQHVIYNTAARSLLNLVTLFIAYQ